MSGRPASRAAGGPRPERVQTPADLATELDRLRQRAARGAQRGRITLERIAQLTGIPRSTVHSYVRGLRLPPADALDALVLALGATPPEQAQWAAALERAVDARAGRPAPAAEAPGAAARTQGAPDAPSGRP